MKRPLYQAAFQALAAYCALNDHIIKIRGEREAEEGLCKYIVRAVVAEQRKRNKK